MEILVAGLDDAVTVGCKFYREHECQIIVCATDGDRWETNIEQRKCSRSFRVMNRSADS